MTVASPLVYPGSRAVAGWWRELAPLQPRALWVGHFVLQHVEALVEVARPLRLDPLARLVLQAVGLPETRTVQGLEARLHLGPQLVVQFLRTLQAERLVIPGPGGEWSVTALARDVLDRGASARPSLERRVFHFLAPLGATGRAPHFLRLDSAWGAAAGTANGFLFDAAVLTACLGRPADWKQRHGFPMDVTAVVGPGASAAGPAPEWQRVILVRPEHVAVLLVLALASTGGERLLGFPVRTGAWTLESAGPVFALEAGWQEAFPELPHEPPPASWRQAWRAWCQPRSVPPAEAEACTLERQSYRLLVRAPKRLVERLRTARSDALKGEAWVLAGSGPVRPLALLEIVEAGDTTAPA